MVQHHKQPALCPKVEYAFTILGKKWVGLIILILNKEPQRFCQIAEQLPISEKVLSQRLKELECANIIKRQPSEITPIHTEYLLTEKGHAMQPIIKEVQHWANKWTS